MMRLIALTGFCLALACGAYTAVMAQQPEPTAVPDDAAQAAADAQTQDDKNIQFWVGSFEDFAAEGIPYGCGSTLLPVDTGVARSGATLEDLSVALDALLNPALNHPTAATEDWLKQQELSVEEISIDDGEAVIRIGGTLIGPGHCGDAIIEGQILHTVFQFEAIERVMVSDGETNLWEMIDLTGWYSDEYRANYVYERPDAEARTIQFWAGAFEDYASEGIPYGCDSFLLPVDTGITRSGNPHSDLTLALEALFDPDLKHPEADTEDWLKGLGLSVEEITLSAGEAIVTLAGSLVGIGGCGDAIMEGQLLQTIFQFEAIERVKVTDGRSNLWEIVDTSDQLSEGARQNYIYSRPAD